jgi:SAM-dependent methyltransferase
MDDPRERYRELLAQSLAADDPTGWFERLYAEARAGEAEVPWDRQAPHPLLIPWAQAGGSAGSAGASGASLTGAGRRALVVGCGLGDDAELVRALGYHTVAFDVSEAAIEAARERHPDTTVEYVVADLFKPPVGWHRGFDLVVEVYTVQALPIGYRQRAIEQIGRFTAGSLVVVAAAREEHEPLEEVPPWPLTRDELESFTRTGLEVVRVELLETRPGNPVWRAEFTRPAATAAP